jgi:hypothetical protein
MLLCNRFKLRVDFAAVTGFKDFDLHTVCVNDSIYILQDGLSVCFVGRIDEYRDAPRFRQNLTRELELFRCKLGIKKLTPVRLPPGRARLPTSPSLTGSWAARKTIGMFGVAAFAAKAPTSAKGQWRTTRLPAPRILCGPYISRNFPKDFILYTTIASLP